VVLGKTAKWLFPREGEVVIMFETLTKELINHESRTKLSIRRNSSDYFDRGLLRRTRAWMRPVSRPRFISSVPCTGM
jgi:hypothetical protein